MPVAERIVVASNELILGDDAAGAFERKAPQASSPDRGFRVDLAQQRHPRNSRSNYWLISRSRIRSQFPRRPFPVLCQWPSVSWSPLERTDFWGMTPQASTTRKAPAQAELHPTPTFRKNLLTKYNSVIYMYFPLHDQASAKISLFLPRVPLSTSVRPGDAFVAGTVRAPRRKVDRA